MKLELNYPASDVYRNLTTISDIKFKSKRVQSGVDLTIQSVPESKYSSFVWYKGDLTGNFEATPYQSEAIVQIPDSDFERFFKIVATDMHGNSVERVFFLSKLPVMYINTNNGVQIESKETKVPCSIQVQGNHQYDHQYSGEAEIHGRGSSSWMYYAQKSYKLKFDKKFNMFGFGSSKHWVLVSCFIDNCFMRNIYAQDAAQTLGLAHANMTPVTVILNGVCIGVYVLSQHIRVDNGVVSVFDWEDEAKNTGHKDTSYRWVDVNQDISVTGGFLYELENDGDVELSKFKTEDGLMVILNRPESAVSSRKMMTFSENLWNSFESAIQSMTGVDENTNRHYSDIVDVDSLVKYLLINMTLGNIDARTRSRYAYIDVGGKLKFGPVWDFDRAMGSVLNEPRVILPTVWNSFVNSPQCFYQELVTHPHFCHLLRKEWLVNLRPWFVSLIARLDSDKSNLSTIGQMNDSVRTTNFISHPYVGDYNIRGYGSDCDYLKTWLTNRLTWLDQQFASDFTFTQSVQQNFAKYPIQFQNLTVDIQNVDVETITTINLSQNQSTETQLPCRQFMLHFPAGSDLLAYDDSTGQLLGNTMGFADSEDYMTVSLVQRTTQDGHYVYTKAGFLNLKYAV